MSSFEVAEARSGERLDVVVAGELGISRSQAAARIQAGEVTVDGVLASKQQRLRVGQRVEVSTPVAASPSAPPPLPPIRFRDDHLVVVAKPPGLVVHPGAGHSTDTLVDALRGAGIPLAAAGGEERPGIVHRLDRDTSGLLVVASTDEAFEELTRQLAAREISRRYLALVAGVPTQRRGRIEAPIAREPGSRTRFGVVAGGKPATTRYVVLAEGAAPDEQGSAVSLLACTLETGRTHQIRVHLTAIGHPVVGDPVYGTRRRIAAALQASRPLLHAASLRFAHPVEDGEVAVDEPMPDDLRDACLAAGITPPGTFASD